MTFRRLLDRRVTIVPRVVTGTDARGNDVISSGTPIPDVPAARDLTVGGTEEELRSRDLQRAEFVYMIPPTLDDGTPIVGLDGYARIIDDDATFEVEGTPDEVTRRRGGRLHHFEVYVYRVTG